ncbi:MAG: Tfp pilus assembly protein PilF [Bryobacterales bacterium]|nr:Tfp pilus assembly protein PilF [Bryobacterales bacterium]
MSLIARFPLFVLCVSIPATAAVSLPANGSDWSSLHQLGARAYADENFGQAEEYFLLAISAADKSNITDVRLLATLNNLASTYTQLGKVQLADEIFQRLGPFRNNTQADPQMLRALIESDINHAAFTFRSGKPVEAQAEFERALEAAERTFNPGDPVFAQIYNHLALLYRDTAQYERARQFGDRALAIREKEFGPKSAQMASSLSVLSQVMQAQGDLAGAEALCRRALAIRREAGFGQLKIAESLSNLGTIVKSRGNYPEAERLYKEAQQIWNKTKGRASFEGALVMNNLGALYQLEGKFKKSEDQFRQAAEVMEHAVGPTSPSLALVLANFSALYREWRKWDQAEDLLRRAIQIDENRLGPMHPHVALDLIAIAQVAAVRRNYATAATLLDRALTIQQNTAGKESRAAADAAFHLAMVYQLWGKPVEALPFFTKAVSIWKVDAGADLDVASGLESYAVLLKRNLQFADAEKAITTAMGMRVQAARNGSSKAFPRNTATSLR